MKRKYKKKAYNIFARWLKTDKPPIYCFWNQRYTQRSKRYLGTYMELKEIARGSLPPEIILIAGRQDIEVVMTTYAHEVRHYMQSKRGLPISEEDAEEFAHRTYQQYIHGEPFRG
jgi:hypothetical protein